MKPDAELASDGRQRVFWCLFVTQFQGAFSDNALKWLAIFVITGLGLSNEKRDQLVGIVGALFALPFIAFSMTGGFLADRFSKCSVTIGVKVFEIFVMLLALAGLATNQFYLTLSCVFLMGVHSAIFGPSKYGLLPELLPERKLSWGNGVLELGTFLAIIGGTVANRRPALVPAPDSRLRHGLFAICDRCDEGLRVGRAALGRRPQTNRLATDPRPLFRRHRAMDGHVAQLAGGRRGRLGPTRGQVSQPGGV